MSSLGKWKCKKNRHDRRNGKRYAYLAFRKINAIFLTVIAKLWYHSLRQLNLLSCRSVLPSREFFAVRVAARSTFISINCLTCHLPRQEKTHHGYKLIDTFPAQFCKTRVTKHSCCRTTFFSANNLSKAYSSASFVY